MKRIRLGEWIFLCFAAGILLGTFLGNQMFGSGLVSYSILYECLERGWHCAVDGAAMIPEKIVLVRLLETAALLVLARSRMRHPLIFLFSLWIGICASALLTVLTWSRGVSGFLYFLACVFPHMIFYLAAWGILLLRYRSPYEVRRGRFWSAVILLIAFGLVLEILVNPVILGILL